MFKRLVVLCIMKSHIRSDIFKVRFFKNRINYRFTHLSVSSLHLRINLALLGIFIEIGIFTGPNFDFWTRGLGSEIRPKADYVQRSKGCDFLSRKIDFIYSLMFFISLILSADGNSYV